MMVARPYAPAFTCLLLGSLYGSSLAKAEEAPLPEDAETPELHTLRMAEEELFAIPTLGPIDGSSDEASELAEPPAGLTSEVPEPAPSVPEVSTDLRWLQTLSLPDLPVRWDDRVVRFLEFFRDDPRGRQLMSGWLRRTHRYGQVIRRELRNQQLPPSLLYVAMVESGFNPHAQSNAGAVGLWQFMRASGQEYGLAFDHWVDERRDPVASTRAAASYLKELYRRLGTWELTLAAYNMGLSGVLQAIRKYNTNDYWTLANLEAGLPFETTVYVAKITACAIVDMNPQAFDFDDITRAEPFEYEVVQAPRGATLERLARAIDVDADALATLNPALRRGRTPAGRGQYALRVPTGKATDFTTRWASSASARPEFRSHIARFGETLDAIADRYGTSEERLRTINALGTRERPLVGLDLLVPNVEPRGASAGTPPVVAVPDDNFALEGRKRVFYRVVADDSISEICAFFEVPASDLRHWNHLDDSAVLQPGMFLQLFVPNERDLTEALVLTEGQVRLYAVGSEEFFDQHETQIGRVRFRYRVAEGDTLASIAERFGLSVGSIARINRFDRAEEPLLGDEIIIYAEPERVPRDLLPTDESASDESAVASDTDEGNAGAEEIAATGDESPSDESTDTEEAPAEEPSAEDASNEAPAEDAPSVE